MNDTVCAFSKPSNAVFMPVLLCVLVFFAACDQPVLPATEAVETETVEDPVVVDYAAMFPSQVDNATLTLLSDEMVSTTIDLVAESSSGQVSLPYGNYSYSLYLSWTENGYLFQKAETGVFTLSKTEPQKSLIFMFMQSDFALMPYFTPSDNPADFAVYAASAPKDAGFIAFREVNTQTELEPMLNAIKGWETGYVKVDLSECQIEIIEGINLRGNNHIVSLILPKTLRSIGAGIGSLGVFDKWKALELVEFPASLYLAGTFTFSNCSVLKTADLSACTLLKTIDGRFFQNCEKLETVIFPSTLKTIATFAFQKCTSLTEIDLSGTQLESIGISAFTQCTNLESVKLPATLKTIGDQAFSSNATNANSSCTKLEIPDFSALPALTSIGNYAFSYCFPAAEIDPVFETLDLAATAIASIGENAFRACMRIEKVILPASLKEIKLNAFGSTAAGRFCANLEAVDFSRCASLVSIGDSAFANTALKQADLSQTALTILAANAFQNCTVLKTVKLPASLESPGSIGAAAFIGCSALESYVFYGLPPTLLNTNALDGVSGVYKIYVATNFVLTYQSFWASFKDKILPLSAYIEIEDFEEGGNY
jgi:hypothetical protein